MMIHDIHYQQHNSFFPHNKSIVIIVTKTIIIIIRIMLIKQLGGQEALMNVGQCPGSTDQSLSASYIHQFSWQAIFKVIIVIVMRQRWRCKNKWKNARWSRMDFQHKNQTTNFQFYPILQMSTFSTELPSWWACNCNGDSPKPRLCWSVRYVTPTTTIRRRQCGISRKIMKLVHDILYHFFF